MTQNRTFKEIKIDCPVCLTGNRIEGGQQNEEVSCEDCGFPLVIPGRFTSNQCLFCGCARFYLESPFELSVLGKRTVCYLCEAEYHDSSIATADQKFQPEVAESMRTTAVSAAWQARIEKWD